MQLCFVRSESRTAHDVVVVSCWMESKEQDFNDCNYYKSLLSSIQKKDEKHEQERDDVRNNYHQKTGSFKNVSH